LVLKLRRPSNPAANPTGLGRLKPPTLTSRPEGVEALDFGPKPLPKAFIVNL